MHLRRRPGHWTRPGRALNRQSAGPAADVVTCAGLLAYRELDNALRLMAIAGQRLVVKRTGKNGRHVLIGMLRQPVLARLAG